MAFASDISLATATGSPVTDRAYTGIKILYAQEKYAIPFPPRILVRGILKNAPINFDIIADNTRIAALYMNDFFFIFSPRK
ncbi:MAG: hypothetical protein IJY83_01250 [Oscillospiraceae bacterium]|nr:hypothetical protein [Oscillospiraceae bacterium]